MAWPWLEKLGMGLFPQFASAYQQMEMNRVRYAMMQAQLQQDLGFRAGLPYSPEMQHEAQMIYGGGGPPQIPGMQMPAGYAPAGAGYGAVPAPTQVPQGQVGVSTPQGPASVSEGATSTAGAQPLGVTAGTAGGATGALSAMGPYGALLGGATQGQQQEGIPSVPSQGPPLAPLPNAPQPRSTVMAGTNFVPPPGGGGGVPPDALFSRGGQVGGIGLPPIVPTLEHAQMAGAYTPYLQYLLNAQLMQRMYGGAGGVGMGGVPGMGNMTGLHVHPLNPAATTIDYGPGELREVPHGAAGALGAGPGGGTVGGSANVIGSVGSPSGAFLGGGGGGMPPIAIPTIPGTGLDMGGGGGIPGARMIGPAGGGAGGGLPGAPAAGGGLPVVTGPRPGRGAGPGAYANDPDVARARKIISDRGGGGAPAPGTPPAAPTPPMGGTTAANLPYGMKLVEKPEEQDDDFRSFMALARAEDDQVGPAKNRYRDAYNTYGSVKEALSHQPDLAANVRADVSDFKENEKVREKNRAELEGKIIDARAKVKDLEGFLMDPKLETAMKDLMIPGAESSTPGGPLTAGDIAKGVARRLKTSIGGPLYKSAAGATAKGAQSKMSLENIKQGTMKYIQVLAESLKGIPRITTAEIRGFGGPLEQLADNKLTFDEGRNLLSNVYDAAERTLQNMTDEYSQYMQATQRKRY